MQVVDRVACRIVGVDALAADIVGIRLKLDGNQFAYRAGQYLDLVLPDGEKRSFSIANRPTKDGVIELHIRQLPGGVFLQKLLDTRRHDGLTVEGPFGDFHFRDSAQDRHRPAIFIATGTGLSPFKAIIEEMVAAECTRRIYLYWGGRIRDDLYLQHWVREQLTVMPHWHFVPVLSDTRPHDCWPGRTGYVHHAVMEDFADLCQFQVYVCGAPIVVQSARADLVRYRGLAAERFFC